MSHKLIKSTSTSSFSNQFNKNSRNITRHSTNCFNSTKNGSQTRSSIERSQLMRTQTSLYNHHTSTSKNGLRASQSPNKNSYDYINSFTQNSHYQIKPEVKRQHKQPKNQPQLFKVQKQQSRNSVDKRQSLLSTQQNMRLSVANAHDIYNMIKKDMQNNGGGQKQSLSRQMTTHSLRTVDDYQQPKQISKSRSQHFFQSIKQSSHNDYTNQSNLKQSATEVMEAISSIIEQSDISCGIENILLGSNNQQEEQSQDMTLNKQIEMLDQHRPMQLMQVDDYQDDYYQSQIQRQRMAPLCQNIVADQSSVSTLFNYVDEYQRSKNSSAVKYKYQRKVKSSFQVAKPIYQTIVKKHLLNDDKENDEQIIKLKKVQITHLGRQKTQISEYNINTDKQKGQIEKKQGDRTISVMIDSD